VSFSTPPRRVTVTVKLLYGLQQGPIGLTCIYITHKTIDMTLIEMTRVYITSIDIQALSRLLRSGIMITMTIPLSASPESFVHVPGFPSESVPSFQRRQARSHFLQYVVFYLMVLPIALPLPLYCHVTRASWKCAAPRTQSDATQHPSVVTCST
jgi:hypothetical protein